MGKSLNEIAQEIKDAKHIIKAKDESISDVKVQLIYAFNGTGKTRLSKEFKELVAPKSDTDTEGIELADKKIIYYNAFTEDLFYWDNDLENDIAPKLKIQPNVFTHWVFVDQGQELNISKIFQYYTDGKLTPHLNAQYTKRNDNAKDVIVPAFSEVTFSYERGNEEISENIKISKGEESCFVWSVFYALLAQVIEVLNIDKDSIYQERETDQFDNLEYVFIDDPVSSLDDNHLIELAVNLAELIKSSQSELKFIITTHNPLFFNVLSNHLEKGKSKKCFLNKDQEDEYTLKEQNKDSPFSYHIFLLKELDEAIQSGQIRKYHFTHLRNILEKTSTFLGYDNWNELLPKTTDGKTIPYENRLISLYNHSKQSGEEIALLDDKEKSVLENLVKEIKNKYKFKDHGTKGTAKEGKK